MNRDVSDEIKNLKIEIEVLNQRLSIIESRERRSKLFRTIKFIFNIMFIFAIIWGIYYIYDYITNYLPNKASDTINSLVPKNMIK